MKAVAAAVLISMVVLLALAAPGAADDKTCFCPCMVQQCMIIRGATREECARACDEGCREGGYPGQPRRGDFCGF